MRLASRLCLPLFLAWPSSAGFAEAIAVSGKPVPARDLFEKGEIPRVRLNSQTTHWKNCGGVPCTYVVGAVVEGTRRYTNVSIRLKGGPGSFRPLEDRQGSRSTLTNWRPDRLSMGSKASPEQLGAGFRVVSPESCVVRCSRPQGTRTARWPCRRRTQRPPAWPVCAHQGVNKQFLKRYFPDRWECL